MMPVAQAGLCSNVLRGVPSPLFWRLSYGQSLGTGYGTQTIRSTSRPAGCGHVMVVDSLGINSGYLLNNPNAPTLSLQPLIAPARTLFTTPNSLPYPQDSFGENLDVAMAYQTFFLSKLFRFATPWVVASSMTAQGATAISGLIKGTTSYNACLYEAQVVKRLGVTSGLFSSMICDGVDWTHGESDAVPPQPNTAATYATAMVGLANNLQTDIQAITGQNLAKFPIPLWVTQQQSEPVSLQGINITAQAAYQAFIANPGLIQLVGPKYQYQAVTADGVHYLDVGYVAIGMKNAQARMWPYITGQPWKPCYITGVSRSGTTLTVTIYVPFPPLVAETTFGIPHQSGQWSMWAGGLGCEFWDQRNTVIAATSGSPIVLTMTNAPANSSGTIAVEGGLVNTAMNGVFPYTAVGNQVTLIGTTGNGTYTPSSGYAFQPIGLSGATITRTANPFVWTVTFTLARTPVGGTGEFDYAQHFDQAYGGPGLASGVSNGRFGCLRDNDQYGFILGTQLDGLVQDPRQFYNWLVAPGPMSVA